jgi:hypothetical protein
VIGPLWGGQLIQSRRGAVKNPSRVSERMRPRPRRKGRRWYRPPWGLSGCVWVAVGAAICHDLQRGTAQMCVLYINVALGVESQGFCLLAR